MIFTDGVMGALIGIGALTGINIVAVAFFFGKLTQKVDGNSKRLDRIEKILNSQK